MPGASSLARPMAGFYGAPLADFVGAVDSRVMLAGTASLADMCHPAWSSISTAWAPGSTAALISARWAAIAGVSHQGMTRAAPLPFFGQIAPKMYAHLVRWS